ncbi:MAG TPA: glycosyltransferase family 9 protein, partial [Gemmatimonadaceae bacterium]|nr:glycosyltransferase family 9 protein [Gemmatimonadaceae bacterium]
LSTVSRPLATPLDRVCIVMPSAVGDAVHVLPVINAIKRANPEAHVSWVLQPGPASLVRGHPAVDDIILFDRKRGWRAFAEVRETLRATRFDVVLALQDYFKAGLITSFARAPIKLGYDRARARDLTWLLTNRHLAPRRRQHIQDEYLEFLTAMGVPKEPIEWGLGPWPDERAWQREFTSRFDRPIAALVIGSSRPAKDWVAERWAAVADALWSDYGLQPVLVGGRSPREVETERVIRGRARHAPVSALDSGLRRVVGILDASALVISLDTGPLHMAVALERPVISLIGYSNPLRTGPYRRYDDLVVNAYGDMWTRDTLATDRRPDRMRIIDVRDVLEKVELWRERYRDSRRAV